ncbi:MAG TPA: hypothetical protein VJB12_03715 [Candidatus Nanoarchaeia archaeon]|nr:hypothetical protein [Candidatus Nanoarchaeia archaeon]
MSDIVTYRTSKEEGFPSSQSLITDIPGKATPLLQNISGAEEQNDPLPDSIPLGIFNNGLSGLEAIVFYLKEAKGLRFCQIAALLNRDDRTIWDSHNQARSKEDDFPLHLTSPLSVPLKIFQDRGLGVLEALSEHLKEKRGMRYCEIAQLLGKDDRTIWTACARAKKKRIKFHAS